MLRRPQRGVLLARTERMGVILLARRSQRGFAWLPCPGRKWEQPAADALDGSPRAVGETESPLRRVV